MSDKGSTASKRDAAHAPVAADQSATASAKAQPLLAWTCACTSASRRRFTASLAGAAWLSCTPLAALAQASRSDKAWDKACKRSGFTKLAPSEQLERSAAQQYQQLLRQAQSKSALASADDPQLQRLRAIARRMIPFTKACNATSESWQWEVQLLKSSQLNAFCMPGGKIAYFEGILSKLQLNDDEVAVIMGHEIGHALLEHARERIGKNAATRGALEIGAALFGLGGAGRLAADAGSQLLSLTFSRSDESEADALGLHLAARAGYDPRAGVSLWQKMGAASAGAPPAWLSTHPSGKTRIKDIETLLPDVEPVYRQAARPPQRFEPPLRR
jgi:predicted Zn-dependent protease